MNRYRIAAATVRKATVEPHTWRVKAGRLAVALWAIVSAPWSESGWGAGA